MAVNEAHSYVDIKDDAAKHLAGMGYHESSWVTGPDGENQTAVIDFGDRFEI